MVSITTVALLERKPSISRDLFSRYWRDVHGVMAARIPGFDSYTQYHVTPASIDSEPFEGIALVTFVNEDDRKGLATSPVAAHIHRDEVNVFRRALLYNLAAGADTVLIVGDQSTGAAGFVVVPIGHDTRSVAERLCGSDPEYLCRYELESGDPGTWNATDVDEGGASRRFAAVFHAVWRGQAAADAALSALPSVVARYRLDEVHVLVEDARATPLGLRGLDALRTIREAGAENQLDPVVENAIYGRFDQERSATSHAD